MVSLLTPQKKKLISNLIKENKNYPTDWGWEGLGQLIYLRTYARDMFKRLNKKEWLYEHELTDKERLDIDRLVSLGILKHKKETWAETIGRTIRGALNIGTPLSDDEIKLMFQSMLDLKMSVSGRALWQLDTKLPNSGLMDSLLNCWFHSMDKTVNFLKIFEKLMLGGGVGFSIQKEFIQHLPSVIGGEIHLNNSLNYIDSLINVLNIKGLNNEAYELEEVYRDKVRELIALNQDHLVPTIRLSDLVEKLSEETLKSASEIEEKGFIDELDHDSSIDRMLYVGDSREGWITLLEAILDTHFAKGGVLAFNTSLIRPYGSLIKGFGGKASGDGELIKGMFQISNLLSGAVGRQLTSVEVMDVICIIASIVVSGNVRRSALLALGDDDDIEYITSKDWNKGNIPNYRAMANLSVATNDTNRLPQEFWDSYRNKDGECIGLFNLQNAQNFGRMGKNKEKDLRKYFNKRGEVFFKDKDVDQVTLLLEDGSRVYKADPMVKGCNPCYDKVSALLTKDGIKPLKDINIGDTIYGKDGWTKVLNKWSNGIKEVWDVRTKDGGKFIGTLDHKVFENGIKKQLKDVKSIDTFRNFYQGLINDESAKCIPSPIISKTYIKRDEVFDLTVDNESHSLWADNLHVSNCAEMNGDDGENCNLSVINIARIETYEELLAIAILLYKFQKAITQGEYIFKDDQAKINQNSRIGIGITGVLSDFEKNKEWGSKLYEDLREFDIEYSKDMNYPQSIKLTVQKPDGTLGLLMGTKAGIHLDNSPFWYRTVRFASNDPLLDILKEKGYKIEDKLNFDGTSDPSLKVVYFCCKSDTPHMTEENTSAVDQIDFNIQWQEAFVDQSVSQTVKFQQEEVESIIEYLNKTYKDNIKAISFLRHSNFSFPQMPYQTITKEEYNDYINKVQPLGIINLDKNDEFGLDDMSEGACEGGVCPIK